MTQGEKALEIFLENETWRAYYDGAPSPACGKAIEGECVRSLNRLYGAEYAKEALEAALGLEDWQYLYRHCKASPRKGFIARKIAELGGKVPVG